MATKKKLLQAAAGTAAASGGAGALNVEDVFSTYLYEGTGSNNYIKNDISLGDGAEENTVLHLTGDTLNDSSPFNHTMTAVGNTSVNTSTKKYGTGSIYFDGTGDYLRAEDSRFVLGSYDFTIEFWLNLPDASTTKGIFHIWDGSNTSNYSISIYHIGNDLTLQFKNGTDSTPNGSISSTTDVISNNTWHHIAAVRYNNNIKLYVDGTAVSGGFDATGINLVMSYLELGTHWDSAYTFTGYIDDFRITRGTARYTSNFTAPTAALPLDVSTTGEGGLVWIKNRDSSGIYSGANIVFDTERGVGKRLYTNGTDTEFQQNSTNGQRSFNANGFTLGSDDSSGNYGINWTGYDYASWTFRKAPKFFDVVTYTGNGTAGRTVSHNLGSVPAFIVIKRTDSTGDWTCYHSSLGNAQDIMLNSTSQAFPSSAWNSTTPTDSVFTLGSSTSINGSGANYVAYLFAHNDGDGEFGPTGDQDIIKCGVVSHTQSNGFDSEVNLGFEPQWLLIKNSNNAGYAWAIFDTMRGWTVQSEDSYLTAQSSNAESTTVTGVGWIDVTSTGFKIQDIQFGTGDYIYIAIRRGPMAVPTDATDVFALDTYNAGDPEYSSGWPVDFWMRRYDTTSSTDYIIAMDRLRGNGLNYLKTHNTDGDSTYSFTIGLAQMDGASLNGAGNSIGWMWRRAPSFCDVVAYTGTGSARTVSHNLGVAPEMIWVKDRDRSVYWSVFHKDLGSSKRIKLNETAAADNSTGEWNAVDPTSTEFTVGVNTSVNFSGDDYIAYLFASLDGVSKVGSFTSDGTDLTIDCGFTSGARFILLRDTSALGAWFVWDTERGIVAGNDPSLKLNDTAVENTSNDFVDPHSSGFIVNSSFTGTGKLWIYYAIA